MKTNELQKSVMVNVSTFVQKLHLLLKCITERDAYAYIRLKAFRRISIATLNAYAKAPSLTLLDGLSGVDVAYLRVYLDAL